MLKQKIISKNKLIRVALLSGSMAILSLFAFQVSAATPVEMAMEEYEEALALTPDLENGRVLYGKCAICHDPEGWGRRSGIYPQIAGQLSNVIIKQLADIRAGNRGNPMMYPFASGRVLQTAQDITDVAAYVSQLPMTVDTGKGSLSRAKRGKPIYAEYCEDCHGAQGEGDNEEHIPLIQGQHYEYLVRQFDWIRIGRRLNADDDMVEQIQNFHAGEMYDVLSYVSHLPPAEDKVAADGWYNTDFPSYSRDREDQFRSETQKLSVKERGKKRQDN